MGVQIPRMERGIILGEMGWHSVTYGDVASSQITLGFLSLLFSCARLLVFFVQYNVYKLFKLYYLILAHFVRMVMFYC